MSNYNNLKTSIDANIKQNGNQEITGPILNSVLNQMVNILGTGYQFAGVATLDPATEPGTPDAKVFYIANGKGTYTNFGGLEVTEDDVVVLYWDTAWHKVPTGIASQAKLSELDAKIGENNGVVCEGTFTKNTVLFTLEDVNIGDTLYLERSAGYNLVTFYDANNVEIENVSVYPSTTQVPVGFAKAVLDYGVGSSTIKVIDKSQMNYRVSKLETDVPHIEEYVKVMTDSMIEVSTGDNVAADLDITNIDDTNPPKTTYTGWDFQMGYFLSSSKKETVYYDHNDTVSNFVKVYPLATYQYNGTLSANSIAFYDKDKNFVVKYDNNYYGATTGFNFVVPKGCYYARFGCLKSALSRFSVIFKSKSIVSNNLTGGNRYSILTKLSNDVGDVAWESPSAYTDVKCDLTNQEDIIKNGLEVVRAADTNIQPCFKYVRNVGDKYSIHLKVKFPSDVHDLEEVSQILDVDRITADPSYHKQILLKKAKTTTIVTAPKFPVAKYNACIQIATGGIASESIIPDGWTKDYLLGADAMSIRYTGDCSVASNQDIRLSIGSGILKIYHGSNDSTIASFTLSSYNSMVALFQALETATELGGTLEDFEVKQLNIDLAISDIIECDVALVTQYDDGNSGTFYDAFPFYFTTKEKNRIYDIEYIVDETYENNNYHGTMAVIDGYAIGYNTGQASAKLINEPIVITIGNPDVQNNGVEILEFSFTDRAESVRPTIKAIDIEGLTNTIEKDDIKIPLHWFTGVINKLKSQGVKFVTMREVKEYENGTRQFPADNNYCIVKYDDSGLINIIETPDLLDAQLRNHIAPSCALLLGEPFSEDRKALMSAVQRGYDFDWHIHHVPSAELKTKWVIYFDYNTWVTQYQASIDKFFDILGYYPDIWTFHACSGNYNLCRFLKNHGFHSCYGPTGDSNISPITRFNAVAHYVITQADYDAIDKMFTSHRIG